ncbi:MULTISPECIES: acetaldehyde dehydrogenase (acetylating) [Psychrilyobacter]|uniref:Acetaldehyde dehydrogenase (Acetylating) n=1 Tax=Psychrilyobacter piezotolerans TaxID=2293438 RepID=A0ABX9KGI8_9FUSO|nr:MULTISPECIES: acetaldehyde dehydrogenase (acetylating) [Psychrilyobacter]MCS5422394.1 acetaldehyde dehydrogenase (acetylating) [Psychrilyobacter sp. S5]NDI78410.1 acetaldehyde dehydrogenase (acetylating) [Psychrilyobacter piezotolerans]RDE61135.1 acetaldehyde dehydrogenase (acetylating) [Psychrilyobacter sp. S5]REI40776.1 acetaldehyde dehydrogenase (acetylating) [Psychrilyobacter piezotolerans]
MDKDLLSIQQVRDLMTLSKGAQKKYAEFSQEKIDYIVKAVVKEMSSHNERLAKQAAEETGFGIWEDKVIKNKFASEYLYEYIKDMKTVGVIKETENILEIGVPLGVVAGIIPSTNPTSTTIYKVLLALKSGNGIIVSPHPNAKNCIMETVRIMQNAAYKAGAPEGLIGVIEIPTLQGTQALMKHKDTAVILATGGEAMVKAAYSSGNPAIGVGPGNGPAFIEKSANIKLAVKRILDSKTFDNGVICASEQSIIVEEVKKIEVIEELKKQGAYFLTREQSEKLGKFILRANGSMNPQIVGKSVKHIATLANIEVPEGTRVMISEETTVSKTNPYSREKLAPILAFYVEKNWEGACKRSIEILNNEGAGHTLCIHSEDKAIIREFGLKKPASRILVNTPGALGGVGGTTALAPAFTLGCGAVGGSSTSDNITPLNLINIRRVAWGIKELEDLKPNKTSISNSNNETSLNIDIDIESIIRKVVQNLLNR